MKLKKNKKHYNFTEKQKRNDSHRLFCYHFHTVGKPWKVWASKKLRKSNRRILNKLAESVEDVSFERYRKYMWWDM